MNPDEKRLRQFGCILGGLFLAFAVFAFFKNFHDPLGSLRFLIFSGFAVLDLTVTFFWTRALAPVEKRFIQLGEILGFVTTRLVLGFVFFLLLTPMALFFKIIGRKTLFPKTDKNLPSYWEVPSNSTPDRFQRQF